VCRNERVCPCIGFVGGFGEGGESGLGIGRTGGVGVGMVGICVHVLSLPWLSREGSEFCVTLGGLDGWLVG